MQTPMTQNNPKLESIQQACYNRGTHTGSIASFQMVIELLDMARRCEYDTEQTIEYVTRKITAKMQAHIEERKPYNEEYGVMA